MTVASSYTRLLRLQWLALFLIGGGAVSLGLPYFLADADDARLPESEGHVLSAGNGGPTIPLPDANLSGLEALEKDFQLLQAGYEHLQNTKDYTGTFRKQERVDGILDEGSVIQVKSRHEPFSLYLKWLKGDRGREVIFVEGENDGEMLVRLGGIRGRILPVFKINPNGEKAREKTRHHVSHVSILNLTRRVLEHCQDDLKRWPNLHCELIVDDPREDPALIRVEVRYDDYSVAEEYRKTVHWIDRQTLLPVVIKTYEWPQSDREIPAERLDEETLLEHYEYTDLRFDAGLTDMDFSVENPDYTFRK